MSSNMSDLAPHDATTEPAKGSNPTSPSRTLPYIPLEICGLIAQYLDKTSAVRLMRTCKALRHAGEIKVFSELNLTGSWSAHDSVPESLSEDDYRTRAATVDLKVSHALSAFKKYPYRQAYVRAMRIEPSDGGPDAQRATNILAVLRLVAPSIHKLAILPLDHRHAWAPHQSAEYGCSGFFAVLRAGNFPLAQVTSFQYRLVAFVWSPLDSWVTQMTKLQELHISSQHWLNTTDLPDPSNPPAPFSDLRSLTLDHFEAWESDLEQSRILARLLKMAPNLTLLRLRGVWNPSGKQECLKALGELKALKTLVAWDGNDSEEGVEHNKLGKVELSLEELAIEYLEWDEPDELRVDHMDLPAAPALRSLVIFSTSRPPLQEYASMPLGPSSASTKHIPSRFLHHIQRCPLLSSILFLHHTRPFPSPYEANFVEPTYFVPSTKWVAEGHRGVIVREYESPRGAGPAQQFFHLRSLSRSTDWTSKHPYVGTGRYFCDWTRFRGRTVPRYVLDAVYKESGEEGEFTDGGRGLRLGKGDGAWRILNEWRDGAGDESEAEDDFVLDGTEDDDLLTDEED